MKPINHSLKSKGYRLLLMLRLRNRFLTGLLLFVITISFFWKLVLTRQYTWIDQPDYVYQVVPWLQMEAAQWHMTTFPLWDPHVWAGQPIVGQIQPGALNPLNWILFSIHLGRGGLISIVALHWYWVLIHFLAVAFCYWLCRDLGLSRSAAVLGGCAFGLGGFIGAIGWPQFMMSGLLLPLIVMFFFRLLRGEKLLANAAGAGALLGASFLSGHHNVPIFFTLIMIGLWVYLLATTPRSTLLRMIAPAVLFAICFMLVSAAQLLPALELGRLSVRWAGAEQPLQWDQTVPFTVHDDYSLYPTALLGVFINGYQHGSVIFIGFIAISLASFGAFARWMDRSVRVLTGIALAGLLFALGGHSLIYGVLYSVVPVLDKARSPNNAEAIFHLGVASLAGFGLDSLRCLRVGRSARQMAISLLSFVGLVIYISLTIMIMLRPEKAEEYKFLAEAGLNCLLLAGLLAAWGRSAISIRTASALTILLLLFELSQVTNYPFRAIRSTTLLPKLFQHSDIAGFLKQQKSMVRVEIDDQEIPYNFGDWFGIDQLGGYLAGIQKSIFDVQGFQRFRMLLATNYFIGNKPLRPDQRFVFEGHSGLKVYFNPSALPRARIAHAALSVPDENAVISGVNNESTDLLKSVLIVGPAPLLEDCEGGDVFVKTYAPAKVVLQANVPCRSMMVLADTWYPGWDAFVDGKEVRIYPAYNVVRGVVLESGQHEVVMRYRPSSVILGSVLCLLGLGLAIAMQVVGGRQMQNRPVNAA